MKGLTRAKFDLMQPNIGSLRLAAHRTELKPTLKRKTQD